MRGRALIKALGFTLMALVVLGLVLTVILAIRANQPFYGLNVYGLPLGTYSTAAVLVIAGIVGLVWLVQRVRRGGGS